MNKRLIRYSLKELCDFAGVPVPAELEYMSDYKFKNVANIPVMLNREGHISQQVYMNQMRFAEIKSVRQ